MLTLDRLRTSQERLPLILLGLIFLLGLFLRLEVTSSSMVAERILGDGNLYFNYAVNVRTKGVFSRALPAYFGGKNVQPDATLPPGLPLFTAALMNEDWRDGTVNGASRSLDPVIMAQSVLSVLTILFVYIVGRLLAGPWVGLGAAALTAISPHLVNINIYFLSEPLFTVVFWGAMVFLAYSATRPDARAFLVAGGLTLALAALVRPTVQYLPFGLAALPALAAPRTWRRSAVFLGAYLALMSIWIIRNIIAMGVVSDPWAMTAAIQVGGYPGFMYNGDPATLGRPYNFDPVLKDFHSLDLTLSVLAERFRAAPGEYLHWYLIGKPLALFKWTVTPIGVESWSRMVNGDIYQYLTIVTPYADRPLFIVTYLICRLLYLPGLLLAALGSLLVWVPALRPCWGQGLMVMRLLSLTFLYVVGIHMIGSPFPRYAIPFQPLVYLLAAGVMAMAWRYWQARRMIERPIEVL